MAGFKKGTSEEVIKKHLKFRKRCKLVKQIKSIIWFRDNFLIKEDDSYDNARKYCDKLILKNVNEMFKD